MATQIAARVAVDSFDNVTKVQVNINGYWTNLSACPKSVVRMVYGMAIKHGKVPFIVETCQTLLSKPAK